jgi:L-rhamnose mutarotase
MERVTFRLKLRPGMHEEYKRMHNNIWPEMLDVLKKAGIRNYTIWNSGDDLFGYYEVEHKEKAYSILTESPVVARWNKVMDKIYFTDLDSVTGTQREMELMFIFE